MLLIIGLLALSGLSIWLIGVGPYVFTKGDEYSLRIDAIYQLALSLIALGSFFTALWLIIK